nr:hypothetical protein CFP56_57700 [Quercus suber]
MPSSSLHVDESREEVCAMQLGGGGGGGTAAACRSTGVLRRWNVQASGRGIYLGTVLWAASRPHDGGGGVICLFMIRKSKADGCYRRVCQKVTVSRGTADQACWTASIAFRCCTICMRGPHLCAP